MTLCYEGGNAFLRVIRAAGGDDGFLFGVELFRQAGLE